MLIAINILVIIQFCFKITGCQLSDVLAAEQSLSTQIFFYYKKSVRPADIVNIIFALYNYQLVGIDEKSQIMVSISAITQTWFDPRLTWNSS